MDFEDLLGSRGAGDEEDVAFFSDAYLVSYTVEGAGFDVRVEG